MSSIKKKIQVLRQRLSKLERQIAGARQQQVEQAEMASMEKELSDTKAKIEQLKKS